MIIPIYISLALVHCDPGATRPVGDLLTAIRTVETNGRHGAVGDRGRAIGPYQIHYVYWKDSKVPGRWQQCRERGYAERVVRAYWRRYCPKALASGDFKTLARVHNGGPRGHVKSKTFGYWQKVQSVMPSKTKGAAISCS